ncbi:MAG: biopolymer transporter ExbD [Deltaproteobacteria bacterium]|nr:biopolymer transporter ExbD [Deltaproteobacteria bacterium]
MFDSARRRRRKRKSKKMAELNLNSMMDMLAIILVFLLCNISSEENDFVLAKNLDLPDSNTSRSIKPTLQVKVTRGELLVDDVFVAKISESGVKAPKDGEGKIGALYNILQRAKSRDRDGDKSVLVFQADKDLPFSIINDVMRTAAMAGYPNYRFAVQKKE